MATGVGLHIAEHACTAAVVSDDGDPHFIIREPILHMSDDGDAELGGTTPPPGYTQTITGFISAVGDPAGVAVDDGEAYRGEDLLATAMFCLINLTADYLNGPAEFYATHPGGWPAAQVFALRGALDYLGLGSVALIGEDELPPRPGGHSADEIGRYYAESAGRAALAVVLETPAGATPPDPGTAENSFLDTIVMPKLGSGDTPAKAYSAVDPDPAYSAAAAHSFAGADPQADPEATYGGPSLGVLAAGLGVTSAAAGALPAADPGTPESSPRPSGSATTPPKGAARTPAAEPKGSRRTAVLIAVAALVGLVIGALGVTAFLRPGAAEPGPTPVTSTVTETPAPPPPAPPQPVAPPPAEPTYIPEPTYEPEPVETTEPVTTPPPVTTTTQSAPAPTTSVPGTTEPSGPTLTDPTTSTTETTTTRTRPGYEFFPFPMPFRSEDPDLPDTGSQEGRQQEAR